MAKCRRKSNKRTRLGKRGEIKRIKKSLNRRFFDLIQHKTGSNIVQPGELVGCGYIAREFISGFGIDNVKKINTMKK
ncbi:MAG: hypothetical protein ACTSQW_07740 [Promethearchaeota archaeon]